MANDCVYEKNKRENGDILNLSWVIMNRHKTHLDLHIIPDLLLSKGVKYL